MGGYSIEGSRQWTYFGISRLAGIWTEAEYGVSLTPSWEIGIQAGWAKSGLAYKGQRLGHINMIPTALFARYRFFPKDRVVPFLFAGAGYSFNMAGKDTVDFDVNNHWLWRVGAGADFFLTRSIALRVDGRYQGTETQFSSGTFEHTIDLGAFVGTVGLVYVLVEVIFFHCGLHAR